MRRAQSMLTRPSLSLSSWSCIGPRRRATAAYSNSKDDELLDSQESASVNRTETSESLLVSHEETTEIEFSRSEETGSRLGALDLDEGDDPTDHDSPQARMTEAELWQQLEQDLDQTLEIEDSEIAEEMKKEEEGGEEEEEEAAAMADGAQPENLAPEMKEARRFFPAGRIMHIVTVSSSGSDETSHERVEGEEKQEEGKVGIYLTQRSLYSKIRLSQAMIRDHLMPIYRRQIERLIREHEEEQDSGNS